MLFQVPAVHLLRCVHARDAATVPARSEWRSMHGGDFFASRYQDNNLSREKIFMGKSVEFP